MASKKKNKSNEEKLLQMLHSQLTSAYATGVFIVKDLERQLVLLSPGKVIGTAGQIIGSKQAKLLKVCALIDSATVELEELLAVLNGFSQ